MSGGGNRTPALGSGAVVMLGALSTRPEGEADGRIQQGDLLRREHTRVLGQRGLRNRRDRVDVGNAPPRKSFLAAERHLDWNGANVRGDRHHRDQRAHRVGFAARPGHDGSPSRRLRKLCPPDLTPPHFPPHPNAPSQRRTWPRPSPHGPPPRSPALAGIRPRSGGGPPPPRRTPTLRAKGGHGRGRRHTDLRRALRRSPVSVHVAAGVFHRTPAGEVCGERPLEYGAAALAGPLPLPLRLGQYVRGDRNGNLAPFAHVSSECPTKVCVNDGQGKVEKTPCRGFSRADAGQPRVDTSTRTNCSSANKYSSPLSSVTRTK